MFDELNSPQIDRLRIVIALTLAAALISIQWCSLDQSEISIAHRSCAYTMRAWSLFSARWLFIAPNLKISAIAPNLKHSAIAPTLKQCHSSEIKTEFTSFIWIQLHWFTKKWNSFPMIHHRPVTLPAIRENFKAPNCDFKVRHFLRCRGGIARPPCFQLCSW